MIFPIYYSVISTVAFARVRVADPDPIQSGPWIRIRNPDPDPGGLKLPTKVEKKIENFMFLKCRMFSFES
jgi:hypothetical protein